MKTILFFILSITGLSLFAQKTLGTDTIRMNVTVAQAKYIVDTTGVNPDFVILDIRTPSEYCNSHIANAIHINFYDVNFSAQLGALDHNKMYLLHCAAGSRSTPTFTSMQAKHFREVYHMNNGFGTWLSLGYPYVSCYTGVQDKNGTTLTKLYPNPAANFLYILFESASRGKLFISNLQGQLLQEESLDPGLQYFDISEFLPGIYLVKIQSAEGIIFRKITIL